MCDKAATPLAQEWRHLIVIALAFRDPIMSAAYLLIVRSMLIGRDVLICRGAGMDFHLRAPPLFFFGSSGEDATCGKWKLSLMESHPRQRRVASFCVVEVAKQLCRRGTNVSGVIDLA